MSTADFDAIVVTEGMHDLLPNGGQAVDAGADWGYAPKPDRRKVIVWSRFPLALERAASKAAICNTVPTLTTSPQTHISSANLRAIGLALMA